ncbi:hypothetical protein A2U01_0029461 [Trifolium medium]|uniref:Uncharacterized protein n=1 Tax=Trifolium medium TaxID=97028 RepID=A0A392P9C2_9FABA|nr:hypothetical protein [Trifolium medium]
MNIHTDTLAYECSGMNIHTGKLIPNYTVSGGAAAGRAVSTVHEEAQQAVVQQSWPGGPVDTSLLTRYDEHIAHHIWFGEEHTEGPKPELRITYLGKKLAERIPD